MKKFEKILDTVMRFLMALSMFALLAGGTWQIFSRMVLGDPPPSPTSSCATS